MSFEDDEYWDDEYSEYSIMPSAAVIQERQYTKRTTPDPVIPTRRPANRSADELAEDRHRRATGAPSGGTGEIFDERRPSWLYDPDFTPVDTSKPVLAVDDGVDYNRPELGADFDAPDFPMSSTDDLPARDERFGQFPDDIDEPYDHRDLAAYGHGPTTTTRARWSEGNEQARRGRRPASREGEPDRSTEPTTAIGRAKVPQSSPPPDDQHQLYRRQGGTPRRANGRSAYWEPSDGAWRPMADEPGWDQPGSDQPSSDQGLQDQTGADQGRLDLPASDQGRLDLAASDDGGWEQAGADHGGSGQRGEDEAGWTGEVLDGEIVWSTDEPVDGGPGKPRKGVARAAETPSEQNGWPDDTGAGPANADRQSTRPPSANDRWPGEPRVISRAEPPAPPRVISRAEPPPVPRVVKKAEPSGPPRVVRTSPPAAANPADAPPRSRRSPRTAHVVIGDSAEPWEIIAADGITGAGGHPAAPVQPADRPVDGDQPVVLQNRADPPTASGRAAVPPPSQPAEPSVIRPAAPASGSDVPQQRPHHQQPPELTDARRDVAAPRPAAKPASAADPLPAADHLPTGDHLAAADQLPAVDHLPAGDQLAELRQSTADPTPAPRPAAADSHAAPRPTPAEQSLAHRSAEQPFAPRPEQSLASRPAEAGPTPSRLGPTSPPVAGERPPVAGERPPNTPSATPGAGPGEPGAEHADTAAMSNPGSTAHAHRGPDTAATTGPEDEPIARPFLARPDERPSRPGDTEFTGKWFASGPAGPTDQPEPEVAPAVHANGADPDGVQPERDVNDLPGQSTGAPTPAASDSRTTEPKGAAALSAADLQAIRWRLDRGTLREVVDDKDALRALGEKLDDPLSEEAGHIGKAGLLSVRAEVYRLLGELGMAAAASRLALAHAESARHTQSMVIAEAELAHVLRLRGDFAEADRLFLKASHAPVSEELRSVVHENAGRCCFDQGRHMEALDHFARAVRLGHPDDQELADRVGICLEAVYIHVLRDGWGPYPRDSEEIIGRDPVLPRRPAERRNDETISE